MHLGPLVSAKVRPHNVIKCQSSLAYFNFQKDYKINGTGSASSPMGIHSIQSSILIPPRIRKFELTKLAKS